MKIKVEYHWKPTQVKEITDKEAKEIIQGDMIKVSNDVMWKHLWISHSALSEEMKEIYGLSDEIMVYGASDDLVEVDGSIREEFNYPYDAEKPQFLAFSDGTVLSILYDNDGIWKVRQVAIGKSEYTKKEAVSSDSDEYSDKVTLKGGNIQWVVFGNAFTYKKPLKE